MMIARNHEFWRPLLKVAILSGLLFALQGTRAETPDWKKVESSALLVVERGSRISYCSAVVIAERRALTAGHCGSGMTGGTLVLGKSLDDTEARRIRIKPDRTRIHSEYDPTNCFYCSDLALLVLAENARLPSYPRISSSAMGRLDPRVELIRIGYATPTLGQMLRTWTPVAFDRYNGATVFSEDSLSRVGDSGGPVYHFHNDRAYLVGIHSTKIGDRGIAGPFVPDFKSWIDSH